MYAFKPLVTPINFYSAKDRRQSRGRWRSPMARFRLSVRGHLQFLVLAVSFGAASADADFELMYASEFIRDNHDPMLFGFGDVDESNKLASRTIKKARKPTSEDNRPLLPSIHGDAQFVCPTGYLLDGNKCFNRVVSPPVESCPYGAYRNKAGFCITVDSVAPEKACPAGFEWYLKGCIRRETVHADQRCPAGFTTYDQLCISRQDLKPTIVCPPGFSTSTHSFKSCVKSNKSPAQKSCPPGFQTQSSSCTRFADSVVTHICPAGFNSSAAGICTQTMESTGKPRCESDYSYTAAGECAREVRFSPSPICPAGTYFHHDHCTQQVKEAPIEVCEEGTVLDAESHLCLPDAPEDKRVLRSSPKQHAPVNPTDKFGATIPSKSCPPGSLPGNVGHPAAPLSECVRTLNQPAVLSCVKGSLAGSQCVEVITTKAKFIFNDTWCEQHPEAISHNYANMSLPFCTHTLEQPSKVFCEKGFRIHSEPSEKGGSPQVTCRKTESVESILSCPPGSLLEGYWCISTEEAPAVAECPTGEPPTDSGRCPTLLTATVEVGCPDGYKIGTYDPGSLNHQTAALCERVEYADVQEVCPVGYNREKQHTRDDKRACVAEKRVSATMICQPGFLSEGSNCVKVVEVSPSLIGPDGELSACRPSRDGDPACEMEMKFYAKVTPKGEKKGSQMQKKFGYE